MAGVSLMTLLDGINEEAVNLLKDKNISPKTLRLLKKVTGVRQIEMAEFMVNGNNFTAGYQSEAPCFPVPWFRRVRRPRRLQ